VCAADAQSVCKQPIDKKLSQTELVKDSKSQQISETQKMAKRDNMPI